MKTILLFRHPGGCDDNGGGGDGGGGVGGVGGSGGSGGGGGGDSCCMSGSTDCCAKFS